MFKILLVEDDISLNDSIKVFLTKKGYTVFASYSAKYALKELEQYQVDIIITDLMMPGIDGIEFIKQIRNAGIDVPIIIISAKDQFLDKREGILSGADDYLVKPLDLNELELKIISLFRRAKISNEHKLSFNKTTLDSDSLTVTTYDQVYELPQKEFQILFKLLSYENKIFTRMQLMDEFWGLDSNSDERTVDTHINRLRDKFKTNPDFEIVTIRGLGYKAVKKKWKKIKRHQNYI